MSENREEIRFTYMGGPIRVTLNPIRHSSRGIGSCGITNPMIGDWKIEFMYTRLDGRPMKRWRRRLRVCHKTAVAMGGLRGRVIADDACPAEPGTVMFEGAEFSAEPGFYYADVSLRDCTPNDITGLERANFGGLLEEDDADKEAVRRVEGGDLGARLRENNG